MKDIIVISKGVAGALTAVELAHQYDVLLLVADDNPLPVESEGINKAVDTKHINDWWQQTLFKYRKLQLSANTDIIDIEPLPNNYGYRITTMTDGHTWTTDTAFLINYSGRPVKGLVEEQDDFIDINTPADLRFSASRIQDISHQTGDALVTRKKAVFLANSIKEKLMPLPKPFTIEQLNHCLFIKMKTVIHNAVINGSYDKNPERAITNLSQKALVQLKTSYQGDKVMPANHFNPEEKTSLLNLAKSLRHTAINLPTMRLICHVSKKDQEILLALFKRLLPELEIKCINNTSVYGSTHFCFTKKGQTSRKTLKEVLERLSEFMGDKDDIYNKIFHYLSAALGQSNRSANRFHDKNLEPPNLEVTASTALLVALSASSDQHDMQELTGKWNNKPLTPSDDWQKLTQEFQIAREDNSSHQSMP